MAEQSKAGDLADLEADLEVEDIQRQFLLALWVLAVLVALQEAQAASEVVSVVASTVEEVEADSEEASKIVEAMAVEEGVLVIKVAAAFLPEVDLEEIVVGSVALTDTERLPLTLQLVLVVLEAGATAEEVMVALVPQIVTVLAFLRQLVGMTRV